MLLEKASATVRERLTAENPRAGAAIKGVVAEVASGIRDSTRKASPDFAAAQAAVEQLHRLRRIGETEVLQYAREREFEETAIALSILCDTPIDVVERALLDPGAEIVLHSGQGGGAVGGDHQGQSCCCARPTAACRPRNLDQALASFNRLQPETARRVLSFFRTRAKKPQAPAAAPPVAVNG